MKRFTKYIILILTLSLSFLLAACSCKSCKDDESYIELNKTASVIAIEGEDKLLVTRYGEIDKDEPAVWSVENTDIISISEKGVIKGKRVGNTVVTCTIGNYTDTCEVTVNTGSYLPTLCFENVNEDECKVLAGTTFDFGAYVRYAGNNYSDVTVNYTLSSNGYGSVNANRFLASYNTGSVAVTATAEWRGVTSILLTKTFNVQIIDNVSISLDNVINNITLYTYPSHMGNSYDTSCYFNVNVNENGSDMILNDDNLAVVVEDQTLAYYSSAEGKIKANQNGKFGSTRVKISYISTKGEEFEAYYDIIVERPVYETGLSLGFFSASTDTIDFASIIGSGETLKQAQQLNFDGTVTNLTIKNNAITGYKFFSNGVNNSEFIIYSESQVGGKIKAVGYKISADVYGFVIRNASDITTLASVKDNGKLSIAVTDNIDATGKTFTTISGFSGSFDGLGHTISNLNFQGGGLFGKFAKGSRLSNVAFVNARLAGNKSSVQSIIGGNTDSKNNEGTIEDVYITVNEQDIIAREYKNFGIFTSFMYNLVVRNVVVEYPAFPMDVSTNLNLGSKYGLFASDAGIKTDVIGALNYKGVYVISDSEGKPAPLAMGRASQLKVHTVGTTPNGNIDDGLYQFLIFSNNDVGAQIKSSSQIKHDTIKYTYDTNSGTAGVGVNATSGVDANRWLYYITPQYEIKNVSGKLEIVPVNIYTPAKGEIAGYKPAWVTSYNQSTANADYSALEGRLGIMVMGSTIARYDSYYDFIANKTSTAGFNDSWDTNYGYPVWKNTLINEINVTANGNVVSKVELVYDSEDTSRISAEIGLNGGSYNLQNVEYSIVSGENVIQMVGTQITAISAGRAFVRATFTVDGTAYAKYVEIDVSLIPGEYDFEQSENLLFSAFDGKLYDKNYNEIFLKDIFGVDVELDGAMLNGSKVAISSDKKSVIGARATDNFVKQGDLRLTSRGTSYTVQIDMYAGILSTAKDLKTVFEIDSATEKVQGYYVLKNDITYDYDNFPIKHADGGSDLLKKAGFMGILDGNGYAIDGFLMEDDRTSGLFGYIGNNVEIKNIAFTNVGLFQGTGSRYDSCANLFAWGYIKNFKLTNAYIEFNDSILAADGYSYGLFYTINKNNAFRMTNVVVETPNPATYCGLSYYGRGFFASFDAGLSDFKINGATGEDVATNAFKDVYIISNTAANGKIYSINEQVLPYYANPNMRASRIYVASNDYTNLPDGNIESVGGNNQEQNGTGRNKYYSNNPVAINYNATAEIAGSGVITALPEGRTELGMAAGTGVIWHIMTIKRYDTAEAMASAGHNKVGNWKVSASGIVWENN